MTGSKNEGKAEDYEKSCCPSATSDWGDNLDSLTWSLPGFKIMEAETGSVGQWTWMPCGPAEPFTEKRQVVHVRSLDGKIRGS
jgi:hypothetical protein